MSRTRKILGLAIEEDRILIVESRISTQRNEIKRAGEFILPQDVSYNEPNRLGLLLNQFLRKSHFTAKNALIGLPAKWLIVHKKHLPPTDTESLSNILKLQAEREFSMDLNKLVFDYTDMNNSTENHSLLLIATMQQKMNMVVATARTAGLNVLSVTSSSLTLSRVFRPAAHSPGHYTLYIRPNYAEFVAENSNGFHLMKHLSLAASIGNDPNMAMESLRLQLQRSLPAIPYDENPTYPQQLVFWDEVGLDDEAIGQLEQCFPRSVEVHNGREEFALDKTIPTQQPTDGHFSAAAGLALSPGQARQLPIDFLNSRISPKKKSPRRKQLLWAMIVGVAISLCGMSLFWDWQNDKQQVAVLTGQLEQMKEDIAAAQNMVEKVSFARTWYSGRYQTLDCLRELTLAFPQEGNIWATNLVLREDMRGIISGQSVNEADVLGVLDKLKANDCFSNVKMLYMRGTGRDSQDIAFAIDFSFNNRN